MTRTRKPPVKPEQRRDWLRRNEENGESPPEIAKGEAFDVRTVRKQIEMAKQEREGREARSLVLRNAMEQHYNDLRKYAEKLNLQIYGQDITPSSPDEEFIAAALHEHLPRSPIWDYLRKKENLEKIEKEQLVNTRNMIEAAALNDQSLNSISGRIDGLLPGIIEALVFQAQQWSHGKKGINPQDHLQSEPAGKGFLNLRYGKYHLGKVAEVPAEYQEMLKTVLVKLESYLRDSEPYLNLEKTATEIERLNRKLREELAVIRLRRIVPGRCKFCPL
jgi:hypothetical protein